jgi:hypothetical protein
MSRQHGPQLRLIDRASPGPIARWTGIALVCLLGCFLTTVHGVEATLHKALPLGSPPDRALFVLDSLRTEHSDYNRLERSIAAKFGVSYWALFVTGNVFATLYYDRSDRLERIDVQEHLTGP